MKKFNVGQRVSQIDPDDGQRAYGFILVVKDDKLLIEWDDIGMPCEHDESEFDSITIED